MVDLENKQSCFPLLTDKVPGLVHFKTSFTFKQMKTFYFLNKNVQDQVLELPMNPV